MYHDIPSKKESRRLGKMPTKVKRILGFDIVKAIRDYVWAIFVVAMME